VVETVNPYLALLIVVAVVAAVCLVPRMRVWRRCRCGTQYCTGCGTKRVK